MDKFEFGENLFSRSAANRLALSILEVARELSGFRKGDNLFFSFRIFLVAFQRKLSVLERESRYLWYLLELCFRRIFFKELVK